MTATGRTGPHFSWSERLGIRPATIVQWCAIAVAFCSLWCVIVAAQGQGNSTPGVTYERILNSSREPQNWLTYSGRYSGWRYSTLDSINTRNVSRLRLQWVFRPLLSDSLKPLRWSLTASCTAPGKTIAPLLLTPVPVAPSGAIGKIFRKRSNPAVEG